MKILMVLTSHDELGDTGNRTGFWLEEFAAPYYVFRDANAEVTLASPQGGQPPLDPNSDTPEASTEATERFKADTEAQAALSDTRKLAEISPGDYDAVFYPGGHGPLWDLVDNRDSLSLIETMYRAGKPVAAVCHAPAALCRAENPDGSALVRGRSVTGFSNSEEEAIERSDVVPFLLEHELQARGAIYSKADDWQPKVVVDGNLITGQNPASSASVAQAVLEELRE